MLKYEKYENGVKYLQSVSSVSINNFEQVTLSEVGLVLLQILYTFRTLTIAILFLKFNIF